MPFGVCNGAGTMQRNVDIALKEFYKFAKPYQDDIIIWSKDIEEHNKQLELVLSKLYICGLMPNWDKCEWFKESVTYCGHVISNNKIIIDKSRIKAIELINNPKDIRQLRSFLGMTNYLRDFIPSYSDITEPLFKVIRNGNFFWSREQQKSFEDIKRAISSAPALSSPGPGVYHLYTDASNIAVGYHLRKSCTLFIFQSRSCDISSLVVA